jgi:peroxiredoxin Q/BCP
MRPKAGDTAPELEGIDQRGKTVRLADFRGRKVVLYFYPRDFTPGCTAQACSLRDANEDIAAKGAAIIGVSAQDEASHQQFAKKHKLDFPLLADPDQKIGKAYGVVGGGLFGLARSVTGLYERVTFIIDKKGKVEHVIEDTRTADHGEQVLALL